MKNNSIEYMKNMQTIRQKNNMNNYIIERWECYLKNEIIKFWVKKYSMILILNCLFLHQGFYNTVNTVPTLFSNTTETNISNYNLESPWFNNKDFSIKICI